MLIFPETRLNEKLKTIIFHDIGRTGNVLHTFNEVDLFFVHFLRFQIIVTNNDAKQQ